MFFVDICRIKVSRGLRNSGTMIMVRTLNHKSNQIERFFDHGPIAADYEYIGSTMEQGKKRELHFLRCSKLESHLVFIVLWVCYSLD